MPDDVCAQGEELVSKMGKPEEFIETLYDILRANRGKNCEVGVKTFCTPVEIVNELAKHVGEAAKEHPQEAFELFKTLWRNGSREEMILVSRSIGEIAGLVDHEDYLKTIMEFVPSINENEVCDSLAENALRYMSLEYPADVLSISRLHVRNIEKWTRRFALLSLKNVLSDDNFSDYESVLNILAPVMTEQDPDVRKVAISVMKDVIQRDPRRSYYFMKRWAKTAGSSTAWIIKSGMKLLGMHERQDLEKILKNV